MARLLRLENCWECVNHHYTFGETDEPGWCECEAADGRRVDDTFGDGIPAWCPLPDAPEDTDTPTGES